MISMNQHVLMSGVQYFDDNYAINPYMDDTVPIDITAAQSEHEAIKRALMSAGVTVTQVSPPKDCQDGVYTANWALCKDDLAIVSRLPAARKGEEAYARQQLRDLGKQIIEVPEGLRFSGQGDALPCGQYLFTGSAYRTDKAVHDFLADKLGCTVLSLRTNPPTHLVRPSS
jgi:N-dimethylarginine dimethylaminohydrolase